MSGARDRAIARFASDAVLIAPVACVKTPAVVQRSRIPDPAALGCRLTAALELPPEHMRLEIRNVAGELRQMSGMLAHLLQVISDHERRLFALEDRDLSSATPSVETKGRA